MTEYILTAATPEPERVSILQEGARLTSGDRDRTYGPPYTNLAAGAKVLTAYMVAKGLMQEGKELVAEDVAHFMSLVKITRTFHGGYHRDNYVDSGTYQAIAGECRQEEERRNG